MKTNTGLKYGVLSYPGSCNPGIKKAIREILNNEETNAPKKIYKEMNEATWSDCIIDFDDISGLTLEDLQDYYPLQDGEHIFFVMYDKVSSCKPINEYGNRSDPQPRYVIRFLLPICIFNKEIQNMQINEVISSCLERYKHDLNKTNQNRTKLFLETYDPNHEEKERQRTEIQKGLGIYNGN